MPHHLADCSSVAQRRGETDREKTKENKGKKEKFKAKILNMHCASAVCCHSKGGCSSIAAAAAIVLGLLLLQLYLSEIIAKKRETKTHSELLRLHGSTCCCFCWALRLWPPTGAGGVV